MDIGDLKKSYYILGLIYADGCLSKQEGKAERITIETKEKDIMKKLHEIMCPDRKFYTTKPKKPQHAVTYKVINTNEESILKAKEFGITYRKSLDISFPKIPDRFLNHFVRGFFDGDGSIYLNKVGGHLYKRISITSGSREFLKDMSSILAPIGFELKITKDSRHNAYYASIYKKDVVRQFGDWMYNDSDGFYMNRKYNIFYDEIV